MTNAGGVGNVNGHLMNDTIFRHYYSNHSNNIITIRLRHRSNLEVCETQCVKDIRDKII